MCVWSPRSVVCVCARVGVYGDVRAQSRVRACACVSSYGCLCASARACVHYVSCNSERADAGARSYVCARGAPSL